MRIAVFSACLAVVAAPARAGDELTPVKLPLKGKVREAAVGPDGTLYFLEGSVVRNSEPKDEPGEHKVFAWDLEKNKEAFRIDGIPAGAVSMAVVGDKLVVACGKEGLAVVDLETKAVKMIKDDKAVPKWVSPDSSRGHALVILGTRFRGDVLAKVALESEHGIAIPTGALRGHVAATTDAIVVQTPFADGAVGGQAGWPTFLSNLPGTSPKMFTGSATSALPYQPIGSPAALKGTGFGWRINFGPFRAVNGGTNFLVTQ